MSIYSVAALTVLSASRLFSLSSGRQPHLCMTLPMMGIFRLPGFDTKVSSSLGILCTMTTGSASERWFATIR